MWSTSGTGTFVPGPNVLNPMYVPSQSDGLTGTITLSLDANSCNHATDQMVLTITPSPVVNAGPDVTVCVSNLAVQLNGKINGGTTTGIWTSSGTGTFKPNNTVMNPVYHSSAADSTTGKVTLVLSSTNNGNCILVRDTMVIQLLQVGIVNAGPDQSHCSNEVKIELSGSISGGATIGIWSCSGTGVFLPDNKTLNAIYKPSAADTAVGVVNFVLSATNSCNLAFDMMQTDLTNSPYVDAGSNTTVCKNNAVVALSGMISFATGGLWSSSGSGTFSPDKTTLTASYIPSDADLNNGSANLYLLSTNNGGCNASIDSVSITYSPEPKANAGVDQIVCTQSLSTNIFGYVSGGGTSGDWSTIGTGTFSSPVSSSENQYNFSAEDKTKGFVDLVLTSTNNGSCYEHADTMRITFGSSVFAYAGADQTVCEGTSEVILNGLITGGSSTGEWSSFGSGKFLPDNLVMKPRYQFSSVDSLLGYAQLFLTSTNNGSCDAGLDTVMITIQKIPIVDGGLDLQICKGTPSVNLIAKFSNTESIKWTSSGSGTFSPDAVSPDVSYTFSKSDSISGNINIYLTSTGASICSQAKDTVNIQMFIPIEVDFSNTLACTGLKVKFNDESVVNYGSITSWQWNFGGGNIINAQDTAFLFPSTGSYPVSLTTTSSLGCSFTKTKQIVVNPTPVAAFGNIPSCNGYQVLFTDLSTIKSGSISAWHWDFGNGSTSIVKNPQNTYPSAGTYNVNLIVKGNTGCEAEVTKPVEIYPPVAGFTYNSSSLQTEVPILFTDESTGAQNWRWDFGGAGTSTLQNPEFIFNSEGTYTVVQIVTNQFNCSDTVSTDIVIESNKAFSPKVPTAFSPNSDYNNDVLFVRGGPFDSLHFKIYNQWGQVVFESNDPTQGWDGKYKTIDQPIGIYVYTVEAETVDGESYAKSGEVTLIR
jgi:gliding motility-associated-like protein